MHRKDIEERIVSALKNKYTQREYETIARWIAEDWSQLLSMYAPKSEEDLFEVLVNRLKAGEPIQYILQRADFFGRPFFVDKRVLIPRPETEELVEWILQDLQQMKGIKAVDIGTGSGCIGITLAKERSGWYVLAADVSTDALAVARENALRLDAEVRILHWNILEESIPEDLPVVDIIVSNPPYIPSHEWRTLDRRVRNYEPPEALRTEGDALQFYEKLSTLAPELLRPGGSIYVECHEERTAEVMRIFKDAGLDSVEQRKDLQGKWRMVKGELKLED